MAITQYYCDPAINANSGAGTLGDPYGDLQHALNTIARNTTDGDRINVKSGTAEVLASALSLATYGTPTATAPLVIAGYTATAGDGGQGEISGGASYGVISTSGATHWLHMKVGNCGAASVLATGDYSTIILCEVYGSSGLAIDAAGSTQIIGNYIHDMTGTNVVDNGFASFNLNFLSVSPTTAAVRVGTNAQCRGNIISIGGADTSVDGIHMVGHGAVICDNIVMSSNANTRSGIYCQYSYGVLLNNIVMGWSGAGGTGIKNDGVGYMGANAFYNCTTQTTNSAAKFLGPTLGSSITLSANPFTDSANGDFSLTDTAKAALRSAGWPTGYLGAHVNSDPHITVGPLQYGPAIAAGGGFPILGGSVIR